jgi:phospholipid/cholesterol/gamma-HCH transport system substrate-binding protein
MKRATFITWEQLRVGALIVFGLLVLTIAVVQLGNAANLFTSRYKLVAFLPNANGLRVGGQVTIAGQIAGTVREINFLAPDADTTRNLKIIIEVDEKLKSQIREDSKGRLRTLGLLGDKIFDITPGTPRFAVLEEGDTVTLGQSLDYEAVIAQASTAVEDMVQLTADLREITGGIVRGEGTVGQLVNNRALYDELTGTLSRANQLMGRLQNPNGTVGKLLDDPQLYQNMNRMLASIDTLLKQVNSTEGTVGKLLRDDSLYTNLVGITAKADTLVSLMSSGNGFAGKMLRDQTLYDQLNKTITDLNAILEDVRRNPRKYTKGMVKVF